MKPYFDQRRMCFWVTDPEVVEDGVEFDFSDPEWDPEGEPGILKLNAHYEVCGRCDGKGTHWHESLSNGITQEDRERDWDDESWEWLMNGGMDVRCSECHGDRVVATVPQTFSNEDRAARLYWEWVQEEADYRALCESERRMGC
jgi:hypothetical protein